jgi:SepF-like predicted cell division protein (DUF552 family)
MKIFDYQNKNGKLIFISKDFPRSTAEKQVKLPKCTVIGYEIKHTQEGKELLIKESRSGDIMICDVTDLSKNVLQELVEDIQKSIRMNCFYLQKHFIPVS